MPLALPRTACPPPCNSRQNALAFNQPLSFDTSSVTNMIRMFNVRSARALWPPRALSRAMIRVHATCAAAVLHWTYNWPWWAAWGALVGLKNLLFDFVQWWFR